MAWNTCFVPWSRQGNGARKSNIVDCYAMRKQKKWVYEERRGDMVIGIDKGEWIAQNKRRNGGGFGCGDHGRPWNQVMIDHRYQAT